MNTRSERGYTLVESLVALFLFSVVAVTFYSVLLSGTRSSRATEDVARVSEEARVGLNRMIRDTREGQLFDQLEPDSYNVRIDFNGDGRYENAGGEFEILNYAYNPTDGTIRLNGQVLIAGVEQMGTTPVFDYTSSDLRYDWNGDGVTTRGELDQAADYGYEGVSGSDAALYSNVHFAFRVRVEDKVTTFRGQAQLRNRR